MRTRVVINFDEFYRRIKTETPFNTQEKLGKALGISRSAISWIKTQLREIPEEWVNKLEKHGFSREWLINGTGEKYNNIAGLYVTSDYLKVRTINPDMSNMNSKEYYSFSATWLHNRGDSKELVMVFVDCEDLSPDIRLNDVVMVDTNSKEPKIGKFFVFTLGNQFLFRKVRLSPNGPELVDNRESDGVAFPDNTHCAISVVGQIIWIGREML